MKNKAELKEIRQAHDEWLSAQSYFDSVADDELIDYAIYNLEACKRRYMYMLSRRRRPEEEARQLQNNGQLVEKSPDTW